MHKYITKFGDMAEYAYSIKATDSSSVILASNFIVGVQNPHVKNKLRSYQVKTLKDIFGHAIQEDQKQKIRALDFWVNPQVRNHNHYQLFYKCHQGQRLLQVWQ